MTSWAALRSMRSRFRPTLGRELNPTMVESIPTRVEIIQVEAGANQRLANKCTISAETNRTLVETNPRLADNNRSRPKLI